MLFKILALTLRYPIQILKNTKKMKYEAFTNSLTGMFKMSKKTSLLFACIGLFAFTATAQEPVKTVKQTKEPVKVTPMERPIKVAPTTDAQVPKEAAKTAPAPTSEAKPTNNVKKKPIRPVTAKAKATVAPAVKAGAAK